MPPLRVGEAHGRLGVEAIANHLGGMAGHKSVRWNVFRDDRLGGDHATISNVHAGQDCGAVPDPHVVADSGGALPPPVLVATVVDAQSELVEWKG